MKKPEKADPSYKVKLTKTDAFHMSYVFQFLVFHGSIKPEHVHDNLDISRDQYNRVVGRKVDDVNLPYFHKMYIWLYNYMIEHELWAFYPEIEGVLNKLFRFQMNFTSPTNSTDEEADEAMRSRRSDIAAIFTRRSEGNIELLNEFSEHYKGYYNIFRYAGNLGSSGVTRIVKAFMHIKPPSNKGRYPTFEVHFPLRKKTTRSKIPRSSGYLFPNGNHTFFIGSDKNSGYPIHIVCPLLHDTFSELDGLTVRRHISGQIMTSRCHLVKLDPPDKPDDNWIAGQLEEVDIYDEEYIKCHPNIISGLNLDELSDRIINTPANNGKGALILK